jgi:hypothetical protein
MLILEAKSQSVAPVSRSWRDSPAIARVFRERSELFVLFGANCVPLSLAAHSFAKNRGRGSPCAATELFVLFCRKMGGGSPAIPHSARCCGSPAGRAVVFKHRADRAPTGGAKASVSGPRLCLRMETTALVMRASVRPESQWGTDLFLPLISHAFLPFRWRMAVDAPTLGKRGNVYGPGILSEP